MRGDAALRPRGAAGARGRDAFAWGVHPAGSRERAGGGRGARASVRERRSSSVCMRRGWGGAAGLWLGAVRTLERGTGKAAGPGVGFWGGGRGGAPASQHLFSQRDPRAHPRRAWGARGGPPPAAERPPTAGPAARCVLGVGRRRCTRGCVCVGWDAGGGYY
ncbi:MAG: hypothetical protein J3K34DRAFT_408438 [Monoraphidium minutum]|nr:MAG: hypothetical protein J3K34DRAFT_408438 [Monoraphidium minutum]